MTTLNPKNFFTEIMEKYKKEYEGYGNFYNKKILAFERGILRIKNKYFELFGEDEIEIEIFKLNIEKMNAFFWQDNTPFDDGAYSTNKEFFEENCLGILEIYEDMKEDDIDFELDYRGNPIYYNFNFHLQNYCFDFVTRDFE